uniref:ATP-dependent DNA helicase n=1 Tax=Octopus bimaculoides TaxID=37653 RepID=A0A0L8GDI2_OCTBM
MLRNLLISQELCNGTHMKVQRLHEHCVEASLVTGSKRGRTVLIPRIKLSSSDANIPFTLNRLQFPLQLAYSMTINKAQGKTFEKVGIHLPQPVFSHGQLYVAFSRARAMNNIKVRVMALKWDKEEGQKRGVTYTQNIVYIHTKYCKEDHRTS